MPGDFSGIVAPLFRSPDGIMKLLEVDDNGGIKANFVPFSYSTAVYQGTLDSSTPSSSPISYTLPATAGVRYCITYALMSYRQRGGTATTRSPAYITVTGGGGKGLMYNGYNRARENSVDKQCQAGFSGMYLYGALGGSVTITYANLQSNGWWCNLNYGGFSINA